MQNNACDRRGCWVSENGTETAMIALACCRTTTVTCLLERGGKEAKRGLSSNRSLAIMALFQDQVNAWIQSGASNTWLGEPAMLKRALAAFGLSHLVVSPKLAGVTIIGMLRSKLKVSSRVA